MPLFHRITAAGVLLLVSWPSAAIESTTLREVVTLSAGGDHACVWADGVWCWGDNRHGQLGLGHRESQSLATPVIGLPGVAQLSLGAEHSCARILGEIAAAGEIWCWGSNRWGQLGTGDFGDRLQPTRVTLPAAARLMAVGRTHSCALLVTDELYCWGSNSHGQLGQPPAAIVPSDPYAQAISTPVRVQTGLESPQYLALGSRHSCAARGGIVQCWGGNSVGQLGDGGTGDRHQPAAVLDVDGTVRELATLSETSCVLLDDGRVRCWGNNYAGQAGVEPQAGGVDGIRTRATPVNLGELSGPPTSLAMGVASSCVTTAGTHALHCWGFHPINYTQRSATPFEVQRFSADLRQAALLGSGVCALANVFSRTSRGEVYCVGQPSALGRGEALGNLHAVRVAGLPERRDRDQLKLGAGFGCIRDAERRLHCFGNNRRGQLGRGHTAALSGADVLSLTGVRDWAAGVDHACAVTDSGTFCWGSNQAGQLGDGSQTDRSTPVRLTATSSRARLVAGDAFTCNYEPGTRSVWCWGSNFYGQLGVVPIGIQSGTLQELTLPGTVLDVQAGRRHVCALLDDPLRRRVFCWGWIPTHPGEVPFTNLMSTQPREVPAELLGFNPERLATGAFSVCVEGAASRRCFGKDWSVSVGTPRGPELAAVTISTPDITPPAAGVAPILLGGRHLCSAGADGQIRCIGLPGNACTYAQAANLIIRPGQWVTCSYGELAISAEQRGWLPVTGIPRSLPQQLAAGDQHACAEIDGELYCWGVGNDLELGSPKVAAYTEPLPVLRAGAREPRREQPVTADPTRGCPGYFVGSVSLRQPLDPAAAGAWGLELLLGSSNRQLHGGLNFGGFGSATADPPVPGYAAFRIISADGRGQRVSLSMRGDGGQFRLRVQSTVPPSLVRQTVLDQTVTLTDTAVERSLTLVDGFHIVELQPLSGERLFLVTASATTPDGEPAAFRDGAVVGGYLRGTQSGFAAVCTSDSQMLSLRTEARSTRGPRGSGDLRLRILDPQSDRVLHDSLNP